MKQEQIILRCEDGAEAVVFTKYTYKNIMELTDGQVKLSDGFEIMVEDSYIGGDYKGFFGRVKRAWRAFWDKPVVYTGIYCEDENKMKQFLYNCIDLVNDIGETV
jgi:hypothetical protein